MTVINRYTVYPFAEMIEVSKKTTASEDIWQIPQYTLIEKVLVRIKVAGTGSASNLSVGDGSDPDGYIEASDAKAVAGTIYGETLGAIGATTVVGDYLAVDSADGTPADRVPQPGKFYSVATEEIKVILSAAETTPVVMQVFIFGKRFDV